jgi:hypothetical protein
MTNLERILPFIVKDEETNQTVAAFGGQFIAQQFADLYMSTSDRTLTVHDTRRRSD